MVTVVMVAVVMVAVVMVTVVMVVAAGSETENACEDEHLEAGTEYHGSIFLWR